MILIFFLTMTATRRWWHLNIFMHFSLFMILALEWVFRLRPRIGMFAVRHTRLGGRCTFFLQKENNQRMILFQIERLMCRSVIGDIQRLWDKWIRTRRTVSDFEEDSPTLLFFRVFHGLGIVQILGNGIIIWLSKADNDGPELWMGTQSDRGEL